MKTTSILTALILTAIIGGCGPKPQPAPETPEACIPYDVKAEVNDERAVISFATDCKRLSAGYNIYISQSPLTDEYPGATLPESVQPFNQAVFPGDTDPDDPREDYEALGLENGVRYYVHVRTVFSDQTLSRPSEEIEIVPGPRGVITLDTRYNGQHDGFSFAENKHVRADAVDNDLYYYSKDGHDYLASPARLGFLRQTRFRVLSYDGDVEDIAARLDDSSPPPSEERVKINEGDWVQVLTEDGAFALLEVRKFAGSGEDRKVTLYYAFSPATGTPLF